MALWLAVSCAFAFALTNGFHDAANSIATLVATRGALPQQAVVLAAVFNMLGALLVGTAVADTIAGIVTVSGAAAIVVIGSGRSRLSSGTSSPGGEDCLRALRTRSSAVSSARRSSKVGSVRSNWAG